MIEFIESMPLFYADSCFSASFNFLLCITYYLLSCKFAHVLQLFQWSLFPVEVGNYYEGHAILLNVEYQL